ncbi:MAG: nitrate reductase [Deltaproteobacteria bacterium]|nr:nitrate reductase [Deltaproteobacteria bacterium]MBW2070571.1 nitrate reductase [Deltaproteobacteria bacterium]
MNLYELLRGPLLWLSFGVFVCGMIVRIILFANLSLKKDRPIYRFFNWKWLWLSIFHWLIPLNQTAKKNPIVTLVGFLFHICLIATPLLLLAHGVLWYESWQISWWYLPEKIADYLTLVTIACALFLLIRRLVLPHVRVVTTLADYVLLLLTAAPFVTGYLAYHQYFHYETMLLLHMAFGELMLVVIPFTKLSHFLMFFVSRAVTGMEFGRRSAPSW